MELWCEHRKGRGCDRKDAKPQFTKAIKDLKKHEKQPQWFCSRHESKHPNVSPITGKEVTRAA